MEELPQSIYLFHVRRKIWGRVADNNAQQEKASKQVAQACSALDAILHNLILTSLTHTVPDTLVVRAPGSST